MNSRDTQAALLSATVRRLTEQGYDVVVEPSPSFLPLGLQKWRPDAVALGKEPKLIVEIASESARAATRIADLQEALRSEPGWKLHLVLDRASDTPPVAHATDQQIGEVLDNALRVAEVDARAGLLMGWAAFEALSRANRPGDFVRPQSPGRLIEQLASQGEVLPSDAHFLRSMANLRNAFIHGDFTQSASNADLERFLALLNSLRRKLLKQS